MSVVFVRSVAVAAAFGAVCLPVTALAQGGLPSDRVAAERKTQAQLTRIGEKIYADIAAANAAIKACNLVAYYNAEKTYSADEKQYGIVSGSYSRNYASFPRFPDPCTPPAPSGPGGAHFGPRWSYAGMQFFVGGEIGGGWSTTTFNVTPSFDVNGSGFTYGLNGGVLFNIPGTPFQIGPRIGWQGGEMPGSIRAPVASPFFTYDVKTKWMFYQEALFRAPISGLFPSNTLPFNPFITASAGIAEVNTQVAGQAGAFFVSDNVTRLGGTFTVGFGVPIIQSVDGMAMDLYVQYRATVASQETVNVPAPVQTDFWTQGINFGLEFRF